MYTVLAYQQFVSNIITYTYNYEVAGVHDYSAGECPN
jgi:hypothetical protein